MKSINEYSRELLLAEADIKKREIAITEFRRLPKDIELALHNYKIQSNKTSLSVADTVRPLFDKFYEELERVFIEEYEKTFNAPIVIEIPQKEDGGQLELFDRE